MSSTVAPVLFPPVPVVVPRHRAGDPDAPESAVRYRVTGANPLQLTGGKEVNPGDVFAADQTRPELLAFWLLVEGVQVVE